MRNKNYSKNYEILIFINNYISLKIFFLHYIIKFQNYILKNHASAMVFFLLNCCQTIYFYVTKKKRRPRSRGAVNHIGNNLLNARTRSLLLFFL